MRSPANAETLEPEMLKALVPEYDGERADPTQLDLFRRQREAIERVRL